MCAPWKPSYDYVFAFKTFQNTEKNPQKSADT